MKYFYILFFTIFTASCENSKLHGHENWKYIDMPVDSACNVYVMLFDSGDYIFRMASSGDSKLFTNDVYTAKYEHAGKQFENATLKRKGKITFEFYSFEPDSALINNLLKITNHNFENEAKITQYSNDRLELELN